MPRRNNNKLPKNLPINESDDDSTISSLSSDDHKHIDDSKNNNDDPLIDANLDKLNLNNAKSPNTPNNSPINASSDIDVDQVDADPLVNAPPTVHRVLTEEEKELQELKHQIAQNKEQLAHIIDDQKRKDDAFMIKYNLRMELLQSKALILGIHNFDNKTIGTEITAKKNRYKFLLSGLDLSCARERTEKIDEFKQWEKIADELLQEANGLFSKDILIKLAEISERRYINRIQTSFITDDDNKKKFDAMTLKFFTENKLAKNKKRYDAIKDSVVSFTINNKKIHKKKSSN